MNLLRDQLETDAAERRNFVRQLDHSSIEALALDAAQKKQEEADAAIRAAAEERDNLRTIYKAWFLKHYSPIASKLMAEGFDADPASPLFQDLEWFLDDTEWNNIPFKETDGKISATWQDRNKPHLHTVIGGLSISADVRDDSAYPAVHLSTSLGNVTQGITSLAHLGELLVQHQQATHKQGLE